MSITSGFFNSLNHDRKYDAVQMSSLFDGILNDGIFSSVGTNMVVLATSGMSVGVGTSRGWFRRTWINNDAIYPIALDASEAILNRIDAIVIEINTNQDTRANTIKKVKGTPASSPANPTLINTDTVRQYPLCYIYVAAMATSITQGNITNAVGTSACPFATGVMQTITTDSLITQWNAQFNTWFANVQTQMSGNVATNLQNQITAIPVPLSGTVPPTTTTVGVVGQLYTNTAKDTVYRCKHIAGSVYTWELISTGAYELVQTFGTAGTYTFTAYDRYGNNTPYEITVIIDGAGGSGGATVQKLQNPGYGYAASGGASGARRTIKLTVTPGNTYTVIVGAGGAPASASILYPSTTPASVGGNSGGSSAFNGLYANGGSGGQVGSTGGSGLTSYRNNWMGGQLADMVGAMQSGGVLGMPAPCKGQMAVSVDAQYTAVPVPFPNPIPEYELLNPFDLTERLFGAGGGAFASAYSGGGAGQAVQILSDGLSAGAGAASYPTSISASVTVTGESASSPSSGGGAAGLTVNSSGTSYTCTATSGAGAKGRVRIYAKKVTTT